MLSDKEATIKLELSQIESKYKMVIPSVDEPRDIGIVQPLFKRNRMPIFCVPLPNYLTNHWTDMVLLYSETY